MKALGIIPARYASTRLPAKPLQLLKGKPLIQRVYENARRAQTLAKLIVATDDSRIYETVQAFGGEVVLTPAELPSGTDRCAFVAHKYDYPIVVNIQGDEPFLPPAVIDAGVGVLEKEAEVMVATAARRNITQAELANPNVVKVLVNKRSEALYFSRQNIPYLRNLEDAPANHPALVHYGLYVFRRNFLLNFTTLPVTILEQMERLEQLRILEHGYKIKVVVTDEPSLGIDTPEDLINAEKILADYES